MALVINNTCEDAVGGDSMVTTTWPLNDFAEGAVGSRPYPDPSTLQSTTTIDATFEEIASEPRGIAVYDLYEEDSDRAILVCGDLGARPGISNEWSAELTEQNGSGLAGHVTLTEEEPGSVVVSVHIWQMAESSGDTSGSEPGSAASMQEVSGPGGIGNTRADILDYWRIDPDEDPVGELVEDGFHYVTYDLPDYQISFMFQLEADGDLRPTDRAIDIIISWISDTSRSAAERRVEGWLPADAEEVGRPERTKVGEEILQYQSATVAEVIPEVDYHGFHQPGDIWVAYWPAESSVGVVEISLFHPRGD